MNAVFCLSRLNSFGHPYSLSFAFRTTLPAVHIVSGEDIVTNVHFSIGLESGELFVNVSESPVSLKLSGHPLNTGAWYRVSLRGTSEVCVSPAAIDF